MKRTLIALVAAAAALAVAVAPVAAITKNAEADPDHPFVGLIGFYDAGWNRVARCTGELIAPTVVLTAGHCTDNGEGRLNAHARIWFEQDAGARYDGVEDPVTGYPVECKEADYCAESDLMYNYGFANFAGFPNTHDVGIVILNKPLTGLGFGSLAAAGTLDGLDRAKGTQDKGFRVSGYGASFSAKKGAYEVSYRVRLQAVEQLVSTVDPYTAGYNLQLNGNGDGRGGTCTGDSGGPVFWPQDTNRIVAVDSFRKNADCRGDNYSYRLDRQAVIDWILSVAGDDAGLIAVN